MEMIFGFFIPKEWIPTGTSTSCQQNEVSCDARLINRIEIPGEDLLMAILGVIFMQGNCASEGEGLANPECDGII